MGLNRVKFIILLFILLLSLVLRLYKIGEVPTSPDWDEVALGYNAYSILLTGRDEYGKLLPIVLRSFDDYKPALYAYLIIPFIRILDLNIVAVRLPSAIFGIIAVFSTYLLVKEIFSIKTTVNKIEYIALLSAFLMAISPWHIQFSRVAFEANAGLTLNIIVALFFLKGLKNHKFMIISAILSSLNIYMYQSEKVFTPLLIFFLIIIFYKDFIKINKKILISSFVIGLTISLPMILYILTDQDALLRAKGVSIFANETEYLKRNIQKLSDDYKKSDYMGLILDNRRGEYAKGIISGYLSHFNLNWLFISGDISRHHAPNMGLLYIIELPFLFLGIYNLAFGKFDTNVKLVIFSIFLLAPIPASITNGVPHAIRTINFLPTFQIFVALGILTFIEFALKIKDAQFPLLPNPYNYKIKLLTIFFIFTFFVSCFSFNILYYLNQYFVQYNYENSLDWQYGYKEAVNYIKDVEKKYDHIMVSNLPHLDQSYMFFLFYLKYPPSIYQSESADSSGGFKENHKFGKYEFRPINWNQEVKDPSYIYVGRPDEFPVSAKHLNTFFLIDKKEVIKIVEG